MKKYIIIAFAALVGFTSCSDDYLTRYPQGAVILQSQYEQLASTLERTLGGVYTLLYAYADHDVFGERSIDMYGDLLSGDMALTANNYGWFYVDELGMTTTNRTGYIWGYYYDIIHNANLVTNLVHAQSDIAKLIAEYGYPTDDLHVIDAAGDTVYTYTEAQAQVAGYYAQALSLRGYSYAQLATLYSYTPSYIYGAGGTLENTKCVPIYTESNMDKPAGRAYVADVFERATIDLEDAAALFGAFKQYLTRGSKLEMSGEVANALLAYTYLNMAAPGSLGREAYTKALDAAKAVIEGEHEFQILPNDQLTTTGFNDVKNVSWLWGQDVTVETYTGLGSFFGQVDIHSYSYAWSGDTKVIDELLYDSIPAWDGRKHWFNDGTADSKFKFCPDGKFYSALSPTSTKAEDIDREWLSDNVLLRLESVYLTAAEAAYRLGDYTAAANYLKAITDQRLDKENLEAATEYATFTNSLSDPKTLLEAIYYNWRVELWGEGYGLQTFRRLADDAAEEGKRRGGNHLDDGGGEMNPTDIKYTFQIPSSEILYNPEID